jgi:hypothetical protein
MQRWGLPPVNLARAVEGWSLQLNQFGGEDPIDLISWAESFGVAQLEVRAIPAQVMVGFSETLGGHPVRVWCCLDSLREAMGLGECQATVITVARLVELAYPGGGESGG